MLILFLGCFAAFWAGLVNSIAGGGGLVQLPALFVLFPQSPIASVLGVHKLAMLSGTLYSGAGFRKVSQVSLGDLVPSGIIAAAAAWFGSQLVTRVSPEFFKPTVFLALCLVFVITLVRRDLGVTPHRVLEGNRAKLGLMLFSMCIGFYDGLIGPGTGSFLLIGFVGLFGWDFLSATAASKVINAATNAAALFSFAMIGAVDWELGIPLAGANILGAVVGTQLTLRRGVKFIRRTFLVITFLMILRFGAELVK